MMPGFWMHETTGVLRPAIEAYLRNEPMTDNQIVAMRAYLRQWIESAYWRGEAVDQLRRDISGLTSRKEIHAWLDLADQIGIDPL